MHLILRADFLSSGSWSRPPPYRTAEPGVLGPQQLALLLELPGLLFEVSGLLSKPSQLLLTIVLLAALTNSRWFSKL